MTKPSAIVANGRERILSGMTYQSAKYALRWTMNRRCAPIIERSSVVGMVYIKFRIRRCVRRHLNRMAPPEGLYLAVRPLNV